VAQSFKNTHYEDTIIKAGELARAIAASSGSVEALAAAAPLLRAIAVAVAGGYLSKATETSRGTDPEEATEVNARYILGIELASAVAAAKATFANAGAVIKFELN
jgi:acyl-CoA dehydrogenase